MVGRTTSRSMGPTSGKSKVSGSWEPKGKRINQMGQRSKPIDMVRKGTIEMKAQRAERAGSFAKIMSRPMKGIKGGDASPRIHALHTMGDEHEHAVE